MELRCEKSKMSNDRDKERPASKSVKVAGKLTYPTTLYSVPQLPDFSAYESRKHLSGPSLRELLKIAKRWKIDEKDVRLLLGGITTGYYTKIRAQPERRILRQDQLTRVAFFIEIYESLNAMLGQKQAAKWVHLTTQESPFRGSSPLSYIAQRGTVAIYELRNKLAMTMARDS